MMQGPASVMIREITQLAIDIEGIFEAALKASDKLPDALFTGDVTIAITGCGDSLQAAIAMEKAFSDLAKLRGRALYPRQIGASDQGNRSLVIGVSASGGTPAVVEALQRAHAVGHRTIMITSNANVSRAFTGCEYLILPLPDKEPSPGIRSYQVSLLGLLAIALRAAKARGQVQTVDRSQWQSYITACRDAIVTTAQSAMDTAKKMVDLTQNDKPMLVLSDDTDRGTAAFIAAKRIEGSGLLAVAQDLEEFWHIDRFALAEGCPVVVLHSPRVAAECARTALVAKGLGRKVISIGPPEAFETHKHADCSFELATVPHVLLSPLVAHIPITQFAALEALKRAHAPFRADRPELMSNMKRLLESHGH